MPVIAETERLVLRTWQSDDAIDAFAIWGNPKVMRYVGEPFTDLAMASRAIDRAAEAQQRHGVSLWAVVDKASNEIVGACGFHFVAEGPELELAYHFKPAHWGRRFATEAAHACVLYAFETLGAMRIIAGVQTENVASVRVLEKIGFQRSKSIKPGDMDEEWFVLSSSTR
jgi:ribosomal-protein-alanine N-acetyltransferase